MRLDINETRQQRRTRIHNLNAVEASYYANLPEHRGDQQIKRHQRALDDRRRAEARDARYPAPATIPDRGRNATELALDLLRCGIFGIGRMHVPEDFNEHPPHIHRLYRQGVSDTWLRYSGPELCQGHLSAYLALLSAARGKSPSSGHGVTVRFTSSELAKAAGWVDTSGFVSGRSLKKVRVALRDLFHANIVHTWGGGVTQIGVHLIAAFEYDPIAELWVIELNSSVLQLFRLSKQINTEKRSRVADGLESWLYGYIRASSAFFNKNTKVSDLYEASAAVSDKKDFRRNVAAALKKLEDLDLIVYQKKTGPGVYEIEA